MKTISNDAFRLAELALIGRKQLLIANIQTETNDTNLKYWQAELERVDAVLAEFSEVGRG